MLLATVDATPFVGVIGAVVMWTGLATVLLIIARYIIRGAAMAVTELLLTGDDKNAEKIARWFARESDILICMKHLITKLGDDPDEVIKSGKK